MKHLFLVVAFYLICLPFGKSQTFDSLPPGFNSAVRCLFYDDSANLLYAGGNFWELSDGTPMSRIAVWNGSQWDSLGSGVTDNVYSIVKFNGDIYMGGNFHFVGGIPSRAIAKWNGTSWEAFGNLKGSAVWQLNVLDNELYVAGIYDSIGNLPANGLAKFDGQNWFTFPTLDPIGFFNATIKFNNELYVGGNFDGGPGLRDIAKFDGTNWVSVGGGLSGFNSIVNDFEIFQNKLYVTGYMQLTNPDPGNGIAIWDGSTWSQAGSGLSPATVLDLFEFQGELYAGGQILNAGGIAVTFIAKWNGTNWFSLGSIFDNVVDGFASSGNDLYIAGAFWTIDGDSVYRIAKYNNLVGLSELLPGKKPNIQVSPNPSSGTFKLVIDKPESKPSHLKISDMAGRMVHVSQLPAFTTENEVCLSAGICNGVYICNVYTSDHIYKVKLIISK